MDQPFLVVLTFAVSVTFSPGPNNIMSASLGMMYGYRRALPFIGGVVCGFGLVMLGGAAAATALLRLLPTIQPFVRYVGAAYLLSLAWLTWQHREDFGAGHDEARSRAQGFWGGFALQFANPKAMAFALVTYSTFLSGLASDVPRVALSATALAGLAFLATSLWALAGTAIRRWLTSDTRRSVAAGVLAAALVYTAAELAGIPDLIAGWVA